MCNLFTNCADGSDEAKELCEKLEPEMCVRPAFGAAGECKCPKDSQFKCDNDKCVSKTKYCNGKKDCSDGSDEPANCTTSCPAMLKYLHPKKLCNSNIDCYHANSPADNGGDEGNEACCPDTDHVRCVKGHLYTSRP